MELLQADACNFREGLFELVLCFCIFHASPDQERALGELVDRVSIPAIDKSIFIGVFISETGSGGCPL